MSNCYVRRGLGRVPGKDMESTWCAPGGLRFELALAHETAYFGQGCWKMRYRPVSLAIRFWKFST